MLRFYRLLLGLVLLVLIVGAGISVRAQGNGPLVLDNAQSSYPLGLHLEYLEDPGGELTIDDVSGSEFTGRFTPSQVETLNFGVTQSIYWIRLRVRNQTSQVSDWRLTFTNARMGLIDLYALSPDNSVLTHQHAGSYLPTTVREYAHPHYVFPVSIAPSSEALIYLRLQSNLPMRFSLSLWEAGAFEQYNHVFFGLIGFFYGIVAIMLVYNLLLYLFLRRVAYLYYVLFILFYTLNTAASDGAAHFYLFPNISLKYGVYGFASLTIIFSVLFIREFLELKWRLPWLSWTLVSLAVIQVPSFALYGRLPQLIALTSLIVIIIAILAILGGFLVWRQGLLSARYFLLGWLGLLLNAILLNSTNVAIIQNYPLFDVGQYISTILLVTFLSLALADQINDLKTKEIQAKTALQESEERLHHLYERAPMGIVIADTTGRIEQANRAYYDILGYDESDLIGLSFNDLVYSEDLSSVDRNFEKLIRGEQDFYEGTVRYLRKDGSIIWLWRSVSALRVSNEKINNTFAMVMDVSERTQVEQKIRESEERFRLAIESAPNAILMLDPQGMIVLINSKAENDFQYSREELIGKNVDMLVPQRTRNNHVDYRSSYFSAPQTLQLGEGRELHGLRKDDSEFPVEIWLSSFTINESTLVLANIVDITERKQAQDALNESELKYRTLVEMANDAIIVIQDEKIKFANARFSEMTRFTSEQLKDTPYTRYLPEEQLPAMLRMYQQRDADATPSIYETIIQCQDGLQLPVEFSASLTTYAGEEAVLVLVRDITARKKLEAELRLYSEHLEELVAERTRELERSREQLAILNRASQTINMTGLDREKVFTAIRAACAWLLPADVVAISLVDYVAGEVEDVYVMDRDRHLFGNRHPLNGSFIGEVLANGVSIWVDDFYTRPNTNQYTNWIEYSPNVRSGMAVLLRGSQENLGVLTVQSYTPNAYTENDQSILESFAAHASITLENIHHYKQLEKSAVIEERQRLASDLHDSVTQLLYSIALMSGGWGVKASQDQLADPAEHFHQIEELSLQALKEMRMLIHQLRPPVLAEVGLLKALEDRLERVERRVEIQASIHVEGVLPRLTALKEEEIYFILLEALNNSLRHARASTVQIDIHTQEKQLHISVVDNGRGYDTSLPSNGMGTAILNNRAATIGAKITRHSQPGQGTRVDLVVGI